jgi:hypothetical protein
MCLPLPLSACCCVRDDLRIKFVRLPDQTLVDRLQERLNVFHDLFPGTI